MSTKVITGKCRASFVHIFEPQSINGSDPKYSISLIIPKSDTKTITAIQAAIDEDPVALSTRYVTRRRLTAQGYCVALLAIFLLL